MISCRSDFFTRYKVRDIPEDYKVVVRMPYHGAFGVWVYGGFSVVNGKDEKVRLENDINADIRARFLAELLRKISRFAQ